VFVTENIPISYTFISIATILFIIDEDRKMLKGVDS